MMSRATFLTEKAIPAPSYFLNPDDHEIYTAAVEKALRMNDFLLQDFKEWQKQHVALGEELETSLSDITQITEQLKNDQRLERLRTISQQEEQLLWSTLCRWTLLMRHGAISVRTHRREGSCILEEMLKQQWKAFGYSLHFARLKDPQIRLVEDSKAYVWHEPTLDPNTARHVRLQLLYGPSLNAMITKAMMNELLTSARMWYQDEGRESSRCSLTGVVLAGQNLVPFSPMSKSLIDLYPFISGGNHRSDLISPQNVMFLHRALRRAMSEHYLVVLPLPSKGKPHSIEVDRLKIMMLDTTALDACFRRGGRLQKLHGCEFKISDGRCPRASLLMYHCIMGIFHCCLRRHVGWQDRIRRICTILKSETTDLFKKSHRPIRKSIMAALLTPYLEMPADVRSYCMSWGIPAMVSGNKEVDGLLEDGLAAAERVEIARICLHANLTHAHIIRQADEKRRQHRVPVSDDLDDIIHVVEDMQAERHPGALTEPSVSGRRAFAVYRGRRVLQATQSRGGMTATYGQVDDGDTTDSEKMSQLIF